MKEVLLIDDDNIFIFLSKKILDKIDFISKVHSTTNGREAIDLLNELHHKSAKLPDIILLDINMPVLDGFGFLIEFKNLNINHDLIKVMMVSSSDYPQDVDRATAFGVGEFLVKPLEENKLRFYLSK